ncbi:SDR family NAD(P)-dependent oxidoreductase [Solicola gregarius]|uniref:SDR family oxidoreductase n=1 Tax=Solicola gregarius TaxID=2908642 RepID=A0AA46YN96_9ACTN|nr:SDR family oxidoreductase [Solicola gregarius]UYM06508.1 SDR family oxidoreductase [Solicola gregarius]
MSRVCMVTGAGQGVGRAVALSLSASGHRVALVARGTERLESVAAELPGPALVVPADVTDAAALDAAFAAVEGEWGPVEVLVSNAGSGTAAPLVDTTDEQWQQALELNLTAPFRCMRRALPSMVEARWGRVVVIASVVAKRGESQVSAYSASKHGVLGLVRAAAAEVARSGVTVNAVCPGYVDTPMTDTTVEAIAQRTGRSLEDARQVLARRQPIGRLVTPDEVAQAVDLCVGSAAINGQGINVDGGAVQS